MWQEGLRQEGVWQEGVWQEGLWQEEVWREGLWQEGLQQGGMWQEGGWREYLFLELKVEVPAVLLEKGLPLGGLLSRQLQPQLPICLQRAHAVLLLVQQVLHLLLVHLQHPPTPKVRDHAMQGPC